MSTKEAAAKEIQAKKSQILKASHDIHAHPELAFDENYACEMLTDLLKNEGFTVKKGVGELATAFEATYGKGKLHIAVCAEYDALPSVGHACGHNIIAAAAFGCALGLKKIIDETDLTLHVIGTPAEERGGGKIILLDRGILDGIHAAMMIHPAPNDEIYPNIIAAARLNICYLGKEAHAAAYPEDGINAADALTIAQVAIGLLRQQIKSTDKIHGIVTKGGDAANIIPAETKAEYIIRSSSLERVQQLREKIIKCFEAGALATGSTLIIDEKEKPYANMIHNTEIAEIYKINAENLGRTFPEINITISTDMGNISHAIPSIHPMIGIECASCSNHQPEFTEYCVSASADQAVIDGSIAMAWTIIDIANNTSLRDKLIKRVPG